MSDSIQLPPTRTRSWKHGIRVCVKGGIAFFITYIAVAYGTSFHLEGYPTLNPREKLLHCAAEAIALGLPVFGAVAFFLCRFEDRVHAAVEELSLPLLYGASLLAGGLIGLVVGVLSLLASGLGVAMAAHLPAAAACGGAAGMLGLMGKRFRPKVVFRIFEWALIIVVCGLAVWLNRTIWQ